MPRETALERFHRIMDWLVDETIFPNDSTQEEMDDINDMRMEVAEVLRSGTLNDNKGDK